VDKGKGLSSVNKTQPSDGNCDGNKNYEWMIGWVDDWRNRRLDEWMSARKQ
jgi:hypothetical protein